MRVIYCIHVGNIDLVDWVLGNLPSSSEIIFTMTKETFEKMKDNNEFLETANVHGNYYGTAKAGIDKISQQNKIPLLDIDVQGAINFVNYFPYANCILLSAPSVQIMRERLQKRSTDTEAVIETRIKNSVQEVD